MFKLLRDFAVKEIFSYELLNARKEEKLSTNELPTRRGWDSPSSLFCPTSHSNQESEGFFCQQATSKGKYGKAKEAVESARAGLSPQEGDVKKKRKEKDQGRREGGSSEGKVPCALHQEFLFLVHEYLGLEPAHLGWSIGSYETWSMRKQCAKEVPETDYFTQPKQYLKRTTLRTYSAKAVP